MLDQFNIRFSLLSVVINFSKKLKIINTTSKKRISNCEQLKFQKTQHNYCLLTF